ncbi:C-type lectin domain-containing protein [Chryseobacterium sp. Leaf394]|uniref:C-type lectin domain-containing protein n=1 Tax=Chryseobacterium sp. Leaf394 TaxID=1736361 RepID=UPI0006F503EE|nr:C-type lectin domain-containing protein [Chryseobacterium sp. Leaf394]KQS91630.1 hypothetical protein ASG21_03950 [Chryseobacterium sp. Leaf394]
MKKILISALLANSLMLFSQIGVGTTEAASTLDVKAVKTDGTTAEGMMMPRLTGDQIKNAGSQYLADQTGTIIYATSAPASTDAKTINITNPGYYYFDGSVWKSMGKIVNNTIISYSTTVDPNILGYIPSKTSTASSAPATMQINGITYTKQNVIIHTNNSHSYTVYSGPQPLDWFQAYNAAKSLGGYLATFTTDAEWQFVESNLLTNSTVFANQRAWMGFVKFSWDAGPALTPDPDFKWITGELPMHNYELQGTNAVKKSNWFAPDEPNNYNIGEGFVHTWARNDGLIRTFGNYTSVQPWNDYPSNHNNVNCFLVEFQQ